MRVEAGLFREAADRIPRGGPIAAAPRGRGRPIRQYIARIRDLEDARAAGKLGVPLHLVTPEDAAIFGFPMTFQPTLVVWRPILRSVETEYRVHGFESRGAALSPRVEDLALVLLRIDPFAARAILRRNPSFVDPFYLLLRTVEEGVAEEATFVRLQDIAPAIPSVGAALPRAVLDRQDENVSTIGLL